MVQSPIEHYLTGNNKDKIRVTHLIVLWGFLGKLWKNIFRADLNFEFETYFSLHNVLHDNFEIGAEDLHEKTENI